LNNSAWSGGFRDVPPAPACNTGDPCAVDFDDSAWRSLSLPHDYGVESAFDPAIDPGHGSLPKNSSWYRKTFTVPADTPPDALVYLEFDSIFRSADVYLNGAFVLHHEEGYTGFIVWLHNASVPIARAPAKNVLAIFVNGLDAELWSYEGMGITRHVTLNTQPALSVVPWGFFVPAPLITASISGSADEIQSTEGVILSPQVDISNAGPSTVNGSVLFSLMDASGALVCSAFSDPFSIKSGGWARVGGSITCGSSASPIRLWNTANGGAYLYNASASILDSTQTLLDAVTVRVGLRRAVFTASHGFTLNGVKVVLRGFSNHVGFGGCGGAVPDRVLEYQLVMLKSIGGNAYRTAHNPVSRTFLDLADEYGVLVWEENRFIELGVLPSPRGWGGAAVESVKAGGEWSGRGVNSPPAPPAAVPRLLQDCQDMVLRDRNHPSIIIWSLCNELGCESNSPTGHIIAAQFKQMVYYADPSRAVTGNIVQRPYLGGRLIDEFGLAMDVTAFSHQNENVPDYRATNAWKAVGLGESGSCVFDRGEYAQSPGPGFVRFSADTIQCIAADMATLALPYNFGAFSWTLNDYLGETYPKGWPAVSSKFGVFDLAGFPKDSAGFFATLWKQSSCNGDVIIANTDWTAPVAIGAPLDVAAFSCAPSVELFVNGLSAGVKPTLPLAGGAAVWEGVLFAPGNITAVSRDETGGKLGTFTLVSAGPPKTLRLWVENGYQPPRNGSVIAADGADVALLGVSVCDENDLFCPQASVNVTFNIQGPAAVYGVANGDPTDHSPVKGVPWRLTFHGLARLIIVSTGERGTILVTASAPGLRNASASLIAQ